MRGQPCRRDDVAASLFLKDKCKPKWNGGTGRRRKTRSSEGDEGKWVEALTRNYGYGSRFGKKSNFGGAEGAEWVHCLDARDDAALAEIVEGVKVGAVKLTTESLHQKHEHDAASQSSREFGDRL